MKLNGLFDLQKNTITNQLKLKPKNKSFESGNENQARMIYFHETIELPLEKWKWKKQIQADELHSVICQLYHMHPGRRR